MIVTKQKPIEEILDLLKPYTNVAIVGCGGCAAYYEAGGGKQVEAMSEELKSKGKNVVAGGIVARQCSIEMVEKKLPEWMEKADVVLSMACGVGVQTISDYLKTKEVIPALNTKFIGRREDTKLVEMCIGCGNCILYMTGGICPVARCPKSHLNGPCGGVDNGKCELDKERDCVWVLIYNKLNALGRLDLFKEIVSPKDFSIASHPGKVEVEK